MAPAADAVLVAGAVPDLTKATSAVLNPRSIALAPDGAMYLTEGRRVWHVAQDGVLAPVPGPWERGAEGLTIITALATDRGGNLFIAGWLQHQIWKLTPDGRIVTIAGFGTVELTGTAPVPANSVGVIALALTVDRTSNIYYAATRSASGRSRPMACCVPSPGALRPDSARYRRGPSWRSVFT